MNYADTTDGREGTGPGTPLPLDQFGMARRVIAIAIGISSALLVVTLGFPLLLYLRFGSPVAFLLIVSAVVGTAALFSLCFGVVVARKPTPHHVVLRNAFLEIVRVAPFSARRQDRIALPWSSVRILQAPPAYRGKILVEFDLPAGRFPTGRLLLPKNAEPLIREHLGADRAG